MPKVSSNGKLLISRCLRLQVCAPDGGVRTHELPEGQVLVIGTSPACGLRLDARDIAGMHCTLEFNDGAITVRDWSTEAGTYLDGTRVDEQTVRSGQFELRIAAYLIKCHLVTGADRKRSAAETTGSQVAGRTAVPSEDRGAPVTADSRRCRTPNPPIEIDEKSTPDDAWDADDEWDRDFDPWHALNPAENAADGEAEANRSPRPAPAGVHDDTSDLLQAEIEFLRSELAERDERLRTLEELATGHHLNELPEEPVDSAEVEKLVGRLEQLLEELEQSDARIAALSEMLRTAEDAVQAADQEREQLEDWLDEVDGRVGQWEQEWHAERDSLHRQIAELTQERDRAEQQLAAGGTDVASGAASDRLVRQLREQYSRLKEAFLKMEKERDQLRARLQEVSVADVEQKIAAAVDTALREERLQLAQEKAAIAREKAALAKKHEELQAQLDRKGQAFDSADHRIRAFREHLREIEEQEPARRQGPTLSQRMGKLWRKLEGRPLDTD